MPNKFWLHKFTESKNQEFLFLEGSGWYTVKNKVRCVSLVHVPVPKNVTYLTLVVVVRLEPTQAL